MTKSMKDFAPTPSSAIRAAIRGYYTYKDNPLFELNIATFGGLNSDSTKCYGCMATCAAMEVVKFQDLNRVLLEDGFSLSEQETLFDVPYDSIRFFEFGISDVVMFLDFETLFEFYEVDDQFIVAQDILLELEEEFGDTEQYHISNKTIREGHIEECLLFFGRGAQLLEARGL